MYKVQSDNMNIAIASGLAEELANQLGHTTEVYGPTTEATLTHGLVVGKHGDQTLYSIKVDDGKVTVKIVGGGMATLLPEDNSKAFEINTPTLVTDLVEYLRDLWTRSTASSPNS